MAEDADKRAKPTEADLLAAQRVKEAWESMSPRPSQDALAEAWGDGGSQSLISQYLSGRIPLNVRAVLFFAKQFGRSPHELYPDLPGLDLVPDLESTWTPEELDQQWRQLPAELKAQLLRTVRVVRGG